MLTIKQGVKLAGLTPQMAIAATVVWSCFMQFTSAPCTITSGSEGVHIPDSLHYKGNALDFRIRGVPVKQLRKLVTVLSNSLGDNFDVVLEVDHIHVEFQPKEQVDEILVADSGDADSGVRAEGDPKPAVARRSGRKANRALPGAE